MDYMDRNIKSNFKQADRLNASYVIIVGEDEVKNSKLTIKNNKTQEQEIVDLEKVYEYFSTVL
jgi:histidyl-tRNA synthetase